MSKTPNRFPQKCAGGPCERFSTPGPGIRRAGRR